MNAGYFNSQAGYLPLPPGSLVEAPRHSTAGPPADVTALATESGVLLTTENGQFLVEE